jgi:transposase InsO family protein
MISTTEGWLYLAVVLDLYSRRVVGWAMGATEDEELVTLALRMALARRHPASATVFPFCTIPTGAANTPAWDIRSVCAQEGIAREYESYWRVLR